MLNSGASVDWRLGIIQLHFKRLGNQLTMILFYQPPQNNSKLRCFFWPQGRFFFYMPKTFPSKIIGVF